MVRFQLLLSLCSNGTLFSSQCYGACLINAVEQSSQTEQLFQFFHRIFWVSDSMTSYLRVSVYLIVITALVRLVAEEMNRREVGTSDFLFLCKVLQAVCLVPARWENIE